MKMLKKLKQKLNNLGSSIVMVVVALGFIGIIVGALLSAAAYAYRLKIQQANAKDNFYYVEQAMQEIYVGVGTHTVEEMKGAYTYTIENMVRYNPDEGVYETISDDQANEMFKKQFMERIKNSPYFKQGAKKLAESLESFISNDSITLDKDKLSIVKKDEEIIIKDVTLTRVMEYDKNAGEGTYTQTISADITISKPDFEVKFSNLTTDYSVLFDYAVVADMGIEINQGDGKDMTIVGNLYGASDYYNKSYNSVAGLKKDDSVTEGSLHAVGGVLSVADGKLSGKYQLKTPAPSTGDTDGTDGDSNPQIPEFSYPVTPVTNKTGVATGNGSVTTGYVNDYMSDTEHTDWFDGLNERSKNSGLFIDNTNVSIMAENVVVPGTIAVMNEAHLAIYGKTGAASLPQVWTDDLVLGGTSTKNATKSTEIKSVYDGSKATFRANLFIKDDTELNAHGSSLSLSGGYYGYGNSTKRDDRQFFTDIVDEKYFMIPLTNEKGQMIDLQGNVVTRESDFVYVQNRGHYNSSAIVVNGENAEIDLSLAKELYVAGRSYIELSKYNTVENTKNEDGTVNNNILTTSYLYSPRTGQAMLGPHGSSQWVEAGFIRDYKTGESIAYKPSQMMYNVSAMGEVKEDIEIKADIEHNKYDGIMLSEKLRGVAGGFQDYFPASVFGGYVPTLSQDIRVKNTMTTRTYTFIDFDTAYTILQEIAAAPGTGEAKADAVALLTRCRTQDAYTAAYAIFYATEAAKGEESLFYPELTDISTYKDFDEGDLLIGNYNFEDNEFVDLDPSNPAKYYSSGAISVRDGDTFTMTTVDDPAVINSLLVGDESMTGFRGDAATADNPTANTIENEITQAYNMSNDLSLEYSCMRFNLDHYKNGNVERDYVHDVVALYGDAALTPINKYMVFSNFNQNAGKNDSNYKLTGVPVNGSNGEATYKIWASRNDITIKDEGDITGIIVTKGDVIFESGVTSFTGMIVSGGKVYFNGDMSKLSSSPQICREILKQCKANIKDEQFKYFINLFAEFATTEEDLGGGDAPADGDGEYNIDAVTYSDVVSMQNWTKSVGGAYEEEAEP